MGQKEQLRKRSWSFWCGPLGTSCLVEARRRFCQAIFTSESFWTPFNLLISLLLVTAPLIILKPKRRVLYLLSTPQRRPAPRPLSLNPRPFLIAFYDIGVVFSERPLPPSCVRGSRGRGTQDRPWLRGRCARDRGQGRKKGKISLLCVGPRCPRFLSPSFCLLFPPFFLLCPPYFHSLSCLFFFFFFSFFCWIWVEGDSFVTG